MYWDNKHKNFIKNPKRFFTIKIYKNYYLFDNNTNINFKKGATHIFANFITKLIIADQWHQIIGYVSLKFFLHFGVSIEGMKILQLKLQRFKTQE